MRADTRKEYGMTAEVAETIQREFMVMQELQKSPGTANEIQARLGLSFNQTRYLFARLRESGNVYRVPGTKIWALSDL